MNNRVIKQKCDVLYWKSSKGVMIYMKNLQVDSILENISNNLDNVLSRHNISKEKIAIYGLDPFSQAIESLLVNRNMSADYYVVNAPT